MIDRDNLFRSLMRMDRLERLQQIDDEERFEDDWVEGFLRGSRQYTDENFPEEEENVWIMDFICS